MNCPQCKRDTTPSEVDREAELATYECEDCMTSWHVDFGRVLRGESVQMVEQDDSTLLYLVTHESSGWQETVPGWRAAVRAMLAMLEDRVQHNGTYSANQPAAVDVELSASPDPEYMDALTYLPHFHINVSVSYDRNADLQVGEPSEAHKQAREQYEARVSQNVEHSAELSAEYRRGFRHAKEQEGRDG